MHDRVGHIVEQAGRLLACFCPRLGGMSRARYDAEVGELFRVLDKNKNGLLCADDVADFYSAVDARDYSSKVARVVGSAGG